VTSELDLISIGRVSVDLYGQQIGSRLEDVSTFAKAVGGCPANVAIGVSRLGLKSALITRVGEEPMGRFVREQLAREGVDLRGVHVDPQRLTSLVLLSVRDEQTFPLIFYRDNCADSALCEEDIDAALVASARALLVTGTHFSLPAAARAQQRAIAVARMHGRRVILDIDYRPNLWGIGGHAAGESRYARSARVTAALAPILPQCDLIVGTEEELHVAAGAEDTLAAIRHVRTHSNAVIVCKRGARGCVVFAGAIPATLEEGLVAAASDIEIYNVLGAGDAFLAGFLSGYLREASFEECARRANACGALAVSRLLCSSEFPSLTELEHYLTHGSAHRALRRDPELNHLHWATTRRAGPPAVRALALDDGEPLVPATRLGRLSELAAEAVARVAAGEVGYGVVLAGPEASNAKRVATQAKLWVAASVHRPGSGPLELAWPDSLGARLTEWPSNVTVKCRCPYYLDDPADTREMQERTLLRVAAVCRAQGRELLLEVSAGGASERGDSATRRVMSRVYALDVRPEWWQLRLPPSVAEWAQCAELIARHDAFCRGILLSLDDDPMSVLTAAAAVPAVRGFIAGGSIVSAAAGGWLAGQSSDQAACEDVARRFRALVDAWLAARDPRHEVERSPT
jgi:5-dehydro-2-deoxygluconokinase